MSPEPPNTAASPGPDYLRDQVAAYLKHQMAAGAIRGILPSERKLAAQMDVSRLTIRAALKKLDEEGLLRLAGKRRLVLPVNGDPRRRLRACTQAIVLSAQPLEEIYHSHVVIFDILRERLARHGFGMTIDVSPRCAMAGTRRALEEKAVRHPDAAWLLIRIPPPGQLWFAEQGLRALVMGTPAENVGLASLDLDYRATCFHAASVLASSGKKTIALIRRAPELIGDQRSEAGARQACREAGAESLIYRLASDSASAIDWLEGLRQAKRMPQGIIACDPAIFLSVYSFCYRHNLRIPEDVAVICRQDDRLLDAIHPSVARYRMNDSVFLNTLWQILVPILRNEPYEKVPSFLMPDFVPGRSAGMSTLR